jgi:hypothetical protein
MEHGQNSYRDSYGDDRIIHENASCETVQQAASLLRDLID